MADPSARPRRYRAGTGWVPLVCCVALVLILPVGVHASFGSLPATGTATASGTPTLTPTTGHAFDWPEIHLNPALTGFTTNTTLSTHNASQLGVRWDTNLYGAAIDSPSVAYDPLLGETLVYIGTENGDLLAVNLATGSIVWGTWLGSPLVASPVVSDGSVYLATQRNTAIFNVNATTGAVVCSAIASHTIEGTAVVATPPGGVRTVYIGAEDSAVSGPVYAMNAANCSIEWQFTGYLQTSGPWDPMAYAIDAKGVPLVLFGTADPDSVVYALNALTGVDVWHFQTYNPPPGGFDVGAGVTISAPGVNGFPGGVAYVPNKYGIMYALNLTTGKQIWSTNFNSIAGVTEGGRSTAALFDQNLVFGFNGGLFDLNARTGALKWQYTDPTHTEILSSPAIAGPNASRAIVVAGDAGGALDVVSLSSGTQHYTYRTGGYITGSPAVSDGNILIASTDGFLYDFAVGGGNDLTLPTTSVSAPVPFSTLANPNGNLVVRGNATDPTSVRAVEVAVESGGPGGPWWNAATGVWSPGPVANPAALASPGAPTSSWTFSYPVPSAGGTYAVTANAASSSGQEDLHGAGSSFTVLYSTTGPHLRATPTYVAPGSTTTVLGGGFGRLQNVTISFLGKPLRNVTTSSTGYLAATNVTIPRTAQFGLSALTATAANARSAAAAVTVLNAWDQSGYNATHSSLEPNDPTFYNLINIGNGIYVHVAWDFVAGAPINASPTIVDDVAYVADTVGALYAIDVHNGGLLWTWTLGSGAALEGAPAVDPGAGLVFVAAHDGTLNAVSVRTGLTVWNATVGGHLGAPVFAGGDLVVTSSSGGVASYAEATGVRLWSATLGSSVTGAASLNMSDQLLVVGESNGDVVALNSSTGAVRWTYATGAAVDAAAILWQHSVLVGSTDHYEYSLAAATGTVQWKFHAGAAIADTGSLSISAPFQPPLLAIGANNGEVYVLHASSGVEVFNITSVAGAVVGVAGVEGVLLIEHANGVITGTRSYVNLLLFNFRTGSTLASSPAIVNGAMYVTGADDDLYAFTSYGQAPV